MTAPSRPADNRQRKRSEKEPELILHEFTPHRLAVLSNRVSGAIAGAYVEQFGLSIPEWRVLAVIYRHPGISSGEVVERTAMDAVAVSRAVSHMARGEIITRETDNGDRRRTVLKTTAKGKRIYKAVVPLVLQYEESLLAVLTDEERSHLDNVLTKLHQQAEHLGAIHASSERAPRKQRSRG